MQLKITNNNSNNRPRSFDGVVRRTKVLPFVLNITPKATSYIGRKASFVVAVVSLLSLSLSSFASLGSTIAYYRDTEKSTENRVEAGTLGLDINAPTLLARISFIEPSTEESSAEDNIGSYQFDVNVAGSGSLPFEYKVTGKMDEENPASCDEVLLLAQFPEHTYDGTVNNFASLVTKKVGDWHFMASLPLSSNVASGAVCTGTITFEANLSDVRPEVKNTWTDKKVYTFAVKNWESVAPVVSKSVPVDVVENSEVPVEISEEQVVEPVVETPKESTPVDPPTGEAGEAPQDTPLPENSSETPPTETPAE